MSRSFLLPVIAFLALAPRAARADDTVDYPREWGSNLCAAENGARVVETSSTATSAEALLDGSAGEGHQWEPSWANGLPASFTLRLAKPERWNKLVLTTRTAGEGYPRDCELWTGKTQADLHCERSFSLPRRSTQIATFEPVEGQFVRLVIKSSWRDDEIEVGEVALFLDAATPPVALEGKDALELRGGDRLVGDLAGDSFAFKGRFFEAKIARADLAAISLTDEGDHVFLASGEVLAGDVRLERVAIKLESGQTVEVPRSKVASFALRARKAPAAGTPDELAARSPVIVLETGERWLAHVAAPRFEVQTTIGRLSLAADAIQSITFGQGAEPLDRIALRNGDSVRGFLLGDATGTDAVAGKLALGPDVSVPRALLDRLVLAPEGDDAGSPENQRIALKTGDVLSGTIAADTLSIRTSYAVLDVALASLERLDAVEGGRVRALLRDGTTLVGTPATDALPFDLDAGGRASVPLDRVRRIENWRVPAEALAKVDALVKKLEDASWPRRDAAKGELAKLGKLALPRLTKLLRAGTPAEKKSAGEILALIKAEEASTAAK